MLSIDATGSHGYQPGRDGVRPGWAVADNACGQYNYDLNENGTVKHYGKAPADYLTTVIDSKASSFITASAKTGDPFLLEVATFSPHGPCTPAPRDAEAFPGLTAPHGPSFDKVPADAPAWLASRPELTDKQQTTIDRVYRKRARREATWRR
ncbi:hypothetical protein M1L60_46430 [Actinoplanes sp. TRM 88003]|uniref:Sulfatase N-terminal domain-containing protein n=1 Tax=Paractinoplanes aksuensis TaxID=2939490 RepID=A0ABT1E4H0_9ACTN|nr:hypothetical protein [Actinoplanes aksuensis]MCO8278034.1 hypothetical protein [Actinoplanes aksuensis]